MGSENRSSYLWMLRLSPRHRGDMAYECVGCLAVQFVPDGQQHVSAVLSFSGLTPKFVPEEL